MRLDLIKIASFTVIIIALVNLVLFSTRIISAKTFWIVIILSAIAAYGFPKLKKS